MSGFEDALARAKQRVVAEELAKKIKLESEVRGASQEESLAVETEESLRQEFKIKCETMLRPLFEMIRANFTGEESIIELSTSVEGGSYMPYHPDKNMIFFIRISWDLQWVDPISEYSSGGYEYKKRFELSVSQHLMGKELRKGNQYSYIIKENALVISPPSQNEWRDRQFFGNSKNEWTKVVTLNDHDWKEKVEEFILQRIQII